jgi:hypothetical protein
MALPCSLIDWLGSQISIVIENVWSIMEVRLRRDHIITSPDKLGIHQADVGEKSPPPPSLFKKLARSLPSRIKMCWDKNSQMIKY